MAVAAAAAAGYCPAGWRGMGQWQRKWMEVGAGWEE
jgi:hypothetical protein